MKKNRDSLIINSVIVVLEIIALIISTKNLGYLGLEFYTVDSNILALISSLILVIYLLTNKKIPRWLSLFKYIATLGLTLTLIVVLFILLPMSNFNYSGLFLKGVMPLHHLICPILGIVSFIFYDNLGKFDKKDGVFSLIFTFVYGIILIILNIAGKVSGPYPFLMVKNQSLLASIIWIIIIYALTFFISYVLRLLRNKCCR